MHGRVGADERLLPVLGWAGFVVPVGRVLVVGTLVAEELAHAGLLSCPGLNEDWLVVVPDLVTEVAEHCSIWLAEPHPARLPARRVRLRQVESDHAVGVTGHDGLLAAGEQVEREAT